MERASRERNCGGREATDRMATVSNDGVLDVCNGNNSNNRVMDEEESVLKNPSENTEKTESDLTFIYWET